ncbi:LppX_LprAFG lipoprotein [Chloroflexota bacterium]
MKNLVLVGIVLLLLAVACSKDDETPPTVTVPSLAAEEIIAKASPMMDTLSSFHFDLSQNGGGTPIAMDLEMNGAWGDIAPPDKLKMTISATWGNMYVETGLITVGEITYMQNPINDKWEELSDDFQAVTLFKPETGIKAVMESVTNLSLLGEQTFGGVLCYHLKGTILSEVLDAIAVGHAAEGLTVDVEFWVGIEDLLLRKVVFDGQICEDENKGIIRTLVLSDFNKSVTIELPK